MVEFLMLIALVLGVSAIYLSTKIEVMKATKQDIDRGYKQCDDCDKLHIFNAGTDYDADEWLKCSRCDCWVVEQKIINDINEV